jgi:hypothetical protein
VAGYVCALGGNGEVLKKVSAVHDHEGTLTVKWKEEPTDQEKGFFLKAWSSVIGDGDETVSTSWYENATRGLSGGSLGFWFV